MLNAFSVKSKPFRGISALAVVISLKLSFSIFDFGSKVSVSIPLGITSMFSECTLRYFSISFFELRDGVII